MKKKVYVCSVYGRRHGLSEEECEANTYKAIEVGRKLILKGYIPFIPHLFHFVHKGWAVSVEEPIYFEIVSSWIEYCDILLVASMPQWEGSGVQREIEIAEGLDIPIYYKLEDLVENEKCLEQ